MKKIMFFISHQPNPRFIKQINYFSKYNYEVSVMYFKRENLANLNDMINKNVKIFLIGEIEDGKYLKRLLLYFKYIFDMKKILKEEKPDKIIITNIDILYFIILSGIKSEIIMEIADLVEYNMNTNFFARVQQYIDTFLFSRYVDKMIFTSLKFYEFYYNKKFKGEYFILENKPLSNMLPQKLEKIQNTKTIIGIVGLLLQGKPYKTLFEFIKDKKDFEVHIYGKGKYEALVKKYANKYKNIKYFGEYDFFKDSAKIYASLDILYMPYDTTNGVLNNKIALPNKLYEAMYFQVPIITSKDTYLGKLVEKQKIGKTIRCCDAKELQETIFNTNFQEIKKNFYKIDTNKYLGDFDYKNLLDFLES